MSEVKHLTPPAQVETKRPIRVVTSTALFDGHDAAINVMRRVLQDCGAEVIHLGHNRSAQEIVQTAIQEDAAAIAVSSYQGGHVEFFKYMVDLLREQGAGHIKVFGGGGGVIVPKEIEELQSYGVCRIYSPEDGRKLGLVNMILDLLARAADGMRDAVVQRDAQLSNAVHLAQYLTAVEEAKTHNAETLEALMERLTTFKEQKRAPVLGVTGTGGAGKSSLIDELVSRFLEDFPEMRLAILSVDPSRKRTGGALLGDRIRMNSASNPRVFMRSLASRGQQSEISDALRECIEVMKAANFELVIVETAGIGQGNAAIVPYVDISMYVMTSDYGAASQLEKIEMIDYADIVAINKFDRPGSEDALRDVRKQIQRNRHDWTVSPEEMPVYGATASRFNDDGVDALYLGILERINILFDCDWKSSLPTPKQKFSSSKQVIIAAERVRYLAEIAECIHKYHASAQQDAEFARQAQHLRGVLGLLGEDASKETINILLGEMESKISAEAKALLGIFDALRESYQKDVFVYSIREKEIRVPLYKESLAGTKIPRVALPKYNDAGDRLLWLMRENVPGAFPFTAGVFPFRRSDEDPTRMFAGEGNATRTNARFHYLSKDAKAKRLSTAFDSVTLYGWDPEDRPDVLGKVGTSGVSIATLDDMKTLYSGFDLASPNTSVSMTINGPAPMILAMFFNTAIDQQLAKFAADRGKEPSEEEQRQIAAETLRQVRGTVQADILKEDQGQNTCIFAIDFALKMMGDIQEYFIQNDVRNFYSVSISGYHIAEAGANPISQLAFTLANGFTYVEHYLSRGMDINKFAPNLSFFFSCGMEPEYSVLNRVARRIWAIAMRERYGADDRSQKLKTHIQTSGRSLHAQDVAFNDIRTTLEALTALYDNCNSLHTNAFDEAVTTPTEESVRRALAIQLIISREHGLYYNENSPQGSFIIEELTDLVEEAVLLEFVRMSQRGGVLGAMERGYQRGKIQDDSHKYEQLKSTGDYPIVGVNTFVDPNADHEKLIGGMELRRGTDDEKREALRQVSEFKEKHANAAPQALEQLKQVARDGGNVFSELMRATRVCTLGQISHALFEVGGQYRRNT